MRPLRMLLQPACTRTKSDQAHSTSSITCACTRPASCCSVLQRPARQAARLPLSADPHGTRHSVLSANQVRRVVARRGEKPLCPCLCHFDCCYSGNFIANGWSNGLLLHAVLRRGSTVCASPKRQLLTPTTLRQSIASAANVPGSRIPLA
jgi:hypothetical protein